MNNTIDGPEESKSNSELDSVEAGKKAIEADIVINKKGMTEEESKREEEADADKWRNEG